jgi:hypothetical protein
MRAEGDDIPDAVLPFLSPLGWQHINLTGDYIWSAGPSNLSGRTSVASGDRPNLAA